MIVIGILVLNSILYIWSGFKIYYLKQYNTINKYYYEKNLLQNPLEYAKIVGLIEFYSGILLLSVSIVSAIYKQPKFAFAALFIGNILVYILLGINNLVHKKRD